MSATIEEFVKKWGPGVRSAERPKMREDLDELLRVERRKVTHEVRQVLGKVDGR